MPSSQPRRAGTRPPPAASPEPRPALVTRAIRLLAQYPWLAALLLVAVSLGARLPFVNAGLFHHDEVVLAQAVEESWRDHRLAGAINGRYGMVLLNLAPYAILHPSAGVSAERLVPLVGIACGALLTGALFLFAAEISRRPASGWFAALFLTCNWLFLTTSTTGKEQVPQYLFVVSGMWLVARGCRRKQGAARIAGILLFAFALTLHESTIAVLPVFAALLVLLHRRHLGSGRALAVDAAVTAAAALVPFWLYLGEVLQRTLVTQSTATVSFLGPLSPVLPVALQQLARILPVPMLGLALLGLLDLRRRYEVLVPLLAWTLLIFYFGNVSAYGPRYLFHVLVPLVALMGIGSALVRDWAGSRAARIPVTLALISVVCGHGLWRALPLLKQRAGFCGPKQMAEYVASRTEANAVVLAMDESVFLEYYAGRETRTHPVGDAAALRRHVDDLGALAAVRPLYAISTAFSYDPGGLFERLLRERFDLAPVGEVVDEHYHRAELNLALFSNRLFRLIPAGR